MPTVVIWGPPCSGKSTYIRDRARPDDVVIDLDRIALALAPEGTEHHAYGDHIRSLARRARLAVLDSAAAWGMQGAGTAWIIDSNADARARARWRSTGARIVKLDVDRATCLRRAGARRPEETRRRINAWFAQHGGPA